MVEPIIKMTCLFDDFVQMPDGTHMAYYEYNYIHGTHYEPGPLVVKVDCRNPYIVVV